MNEKYIILGAGGHAKVILEALRLLDKKILGVVDPALIASEGAHWRGCKILFGSEYDAISEYSPKELYLVNAVGSLPGLTARYNIKKTYSEMGYRFATVVHPKACVSSCAKLAEGVQVMAGAIIQTDSIIEENCIINTSSSIDHDSVIGQDTHVAPGATICGSVQVGKSCHIGVGAVIAQNVSLGDGCIIGAGAVVVKNLPAYSKVLPQPMRVTQYV